MQPLTQDMHTMQLAVEATFLEAALQVVEPAAEMLPDNQTRAVEKLAFDWILNTERYVGPQYPELHKARDKVHLSGSGIVQFTQHECKVARHAVEEAACSILQLGAYNSHYQTVAGPLQDGSQFVYCHVVAPTMC